MSTTQNKIEFAITREKLAAALTLIGLLFSLVGYLGMANINAKLEIIETTNTKLDQVFTKLERLSTHEDDIKYIKEQLIEAKGAIKELQIVVSNQGNAIIELKANANHRR